MASLSDIISAYELLGSLDEETEESELEPYDTYTVVVPQPGYHLANNPDPRLTSFPLAEATTLEELQEYYVYQFFIYIENSAGQGGASMRIVQEMPESGMILMF